MRRTAAAIALALLPALGHAAFNLSDVDFHCSDALTISKAAKLSVQCTGNLSVSGLGGGARLTADESITLSATGSLSLSKLSVVSPLIALQVENGVLSLAPDVSLFSSFDAASAAPDVALTHGGVTLRPPLAPAAGLVVHQATPADVLDWPQLVITPHGAGTITLNNAGDSLQWSMAPVVSAPLGAGGSVSTGATSLSVIAQPLPSVPEPSTLALGLVSLLCLLTWPGRQD